MRRIIAFVVGCIILLIPHTYITPSLSTQTETHRLLAKVTEADMRCLTDNIYHEARNQGVDGKIAVAFVTLNRLLHSDYPSTVCSIVHHKLTPRVCQFSWSCMKVKVTDTKAYQDALTVARAVVSGYNKHIKDPTYGALFYHAVYVSPKWRKQVQKTVQIKDHIFYRPKNGI